MDPLAVSAYGAEQALPLTGTGTGTGPWPPRIKISMVGKIGLND